MGGGGAAVAVARVGADDGPGRGGERRHHGEPGAQLPVQLGGGARVPGVGVTRSPHRHPGANNALQCHFQNMCQTIAPPFLLTGGLAPKNQRPGVGDPGVYSLQRDVKLSNCLLLLVLFLALAEINNNLLQSIFHLAKLSCV